MKFCILFIFVLYFAMQLQSQPYPVFSQEIQVEITGLTTDAMEPFLSPDGQTLFYNSLNSGGNTNLYYASRVNDSLFTFQGMVGGTYDPLPGHLDAVPSLDAAGNFFWMSLRGYPEYIQNLHMGRYNAGQVSDTTRVYGDFNIPTLGWIIMDAAISNGGDTLIYCNAFFDFIFNSCGTGIPCHARLGAALKTDDSTFYKLTGSESLFAAINDTSYLVYAPQLSANGLELYYTRLLKGSINTEICVATRISNMHPFGMPQVLYSNPGYVPEAPTVDPACQKMYYHQKNNSGVFRIYLRYRTSPVTSPWQKKETTCNAWYGNGYIYFSPDNPGLSVSIYSPDGRYISSHDDVSAIPVQHLSPGVYLLFITHNGNSQQLKVAVGN